MEKHGDLFGSSDVCPHKRGVCISGVWIRGDSWIPLHVSITIDSVSLLTPPDASVLS